MDRTTPPCSALPGPSAEGAPVGLTSSQEQMDFYGAASRAYGARICNVVPPLVTPLGRGLHEGPPPTAVQAAVTRDRMALLTAVITQLKTPQATVQALDTVLATHLAASGDRR